MPRFLSPDWVAAFNAALVDVDLAQAGADRSLAASSGSYRVAQVVLDPPAELLAASTADQQAAIRTLLVVDGDRVTLTVDPDPGAMGQPGPKDADVVVVLSYDDAAALSRAELDPVRALSSGRVRVRGDLSALVASQALLAAASAALTPLRDETTF